MLKDIDTLKKLMMNMIPKEMFWAYGIWCVSIQC